MLGKVCETNDSKESFQIIYNKKTQYISLDVLGFLLKIHLLKNADLHVCQIEFGKLNLAFHFCKLGKNK